MAREQTVQAQAQVAALVLALVCLATGVAANITYKNEKPYDLDKGRKGSEPITHYYDWKIVNTKVTRLCESKTIVTINNEFPGPAIHIREDDTVVIKVTNRVEHNVTLHWHGLKMVLQNWQDGPAYVTMCPIQPGDSFTYRFTVDHSQRGTVWYHAHITWLRATLHGAFIVYPKKGVPYPFPKPYAEETLIFGEWWKPDTEEVEVDAIRVGAAYRISDALTLNGQPGDLYNCSAKEITKLKVEAGKTYLLRIINAALNFELYFSIAGHVLTVVEADAEYTKPFTTDVLLITPGQSTNVLLKASQKKGGEYYIATSVWSPAPTKSVPFPTTPATAILEYVKPKKDGKKKRSALPKFPAFNDSQFALDFDEKFRSLANKQFPISVPTKLDEHQEFTIGYNFQACKPEDGCVIKTPGGVFRLRTSINNITFVAPTKSLLEAYYFREKNVFTTNFPDTPKYKYNFTGPTQPGSLLGESGTRLNVLKFGANVQLVFQNTNSLFFESHPFHLHGFSFFIVGSGFGTFDEKVHTKTFNLKDPPLRNTAAVPAGGWTAIRFKADNPGVWFMHCHLEIHTSWGMAMAFIVKDGKGPEETLPGPPPFMPKC